MRVTVLIMAHRATRELLHRAIESCFTSELVDAVVLGDAGKNFAEMDSLLHGLPIEIARRVSVVSIIENVSLGDNRRRMVQGCEAEFVQFLDHDDLFVPDLETFHLQAARVFERRGDAVAVFGDTLEAHPDGTSWPMSIRDGRRPWPSAYGWPPWWGDESEVVFEEIFRQCPSQTAAWIFRRKPLADAGVCESIWVAEDLDMMLRAAAIGSVFALRVPVVIYDLLSETSVVAREMGRVGRGYEASWRRAQELAVQRLGRPLFCTFDEHWRPRPPERWDESWRDEYPPDEQIWDFSRDPATKE